MLALSVVLATYNRADTLRRTLAYLAKQDLDPALYEVIVIDDGSPDHTKSVVEDLARTSPYALRYLHHADRGCGYTQNRGIREAAAPIVLLMADDIWFVPGALRAHLDSHDKNPQLEVAVLGKVLQSAEMNQTIFLRHWDPFGFRNLTGARELPFTRFWVCNISVKRDFMLRYAMFRETVGPAGAPDHHDIEVGYRLARHGLRILYNEEALGYHYHPCTLQQMIDRWYERGLNWPTFRKLVPAPEVLLLAHLFTLRTLPEVLRMLRRPNAVPGNSRSPSGYIARTVLRKVAFNRLTVPWFWRPLVDRAETSPRLARLMNRRIYQGLIHYHFVNGIHDAGKRFGD